MYQQVSERPTAFITVDKGRRKVKEGKFVYLKNGQEFEIELFNPSSQTVLAKIQMNGKMISSSGIVLRPGERVFLERFLDDSQKFLFDTYEVNGKSKSVQKAIEKNGVLKVDFYGENITPVALTSTWVNTTGTYYGNSNYTNINHTFTSGSDTTTLGGEFVSPGVFTVDCDSTSTSQLTTTTSSGAAGLGMNTISGSDIAPPTKKVKSKKMETGRVEKGSNSDQSFEYVDKKFYSYTTATIEYQIKPISQMRMTAKEAVNVTKYCTVCGKKGKHTHKFCANCGDKL